MIVRVLFILFFTWSVGGSAVSGLRGEPADNSTFRLDYQYYPKADGWLKLHRVPSTWYEARRTCHLEGAVLASPTNEGLSLIMRSLAQEEHLPTIHIGVHATASVEDYKSVEGVPLIQMPTPWAAGEPNNLDNKERCLTMTARGEMADVVCESDATRPYFCYKQKDGFISMNKCGYNDNQYQVDPLTGNCYKFHGRQTNWTQALTVCTAEGGTLAVINSEAEARFLAKLVSQNNYTAWVHLGFYMWEQIEPWFTIDGKTLKEAGYERWDKGQPNNYGSNEYCGTMNFSSNDLPELNDSNCANDYPFICEIPSLPKQ